jgi:hypothetical protein
MEPPWQVLVRLRVELQHYILPTALDKIGDCICNPAYV